MYSAERSMPSLAVVDFETTRLMVAPFATAPDHSASAAASSSSLAVTPGSAPFKLLFLDGVEGYYPGGGPKAAIHSGLDSALGSHPCVALSSYQAFLLYGSRGSPPKQNHPQIGRA